MRAFVPLVSAVLLSVCLLACADENGDLNRVGLQKLDVRDAILGGDSDGDGGTEGNGGDGTGTDSVQVFQRTTYPLVQQWCDKCHASTQAPVFAAGDVNVAHDALLDAQKVDFQDPSKSRLVLRLLVDKHQCPAEGCETSAAKMQASIEEWAKALKVSDDPALSGASTDVLRMADAATKRLEGGNPPNVIRLEAEAGTFKAPMAMVAVGTASGGKVAQTPAGAGTQNNAQTAATQVTLGSVIYDVTVAVAGVYRVHGLVNAPTTANNGFWVKMDAGALQGWVVPVNGANYTWDLADTNADLGTTLTFNLTAGNHKLEIRQREELTKIDAIVLTSDVAFNPVNAKPPFRDISLLTYDLSTKLNMPGAKFTVEVTDYSVNAYMFKNPTLVLPSGKVRVKNLKLLINGTFLPQHATYTVVDTTVAAPGGVLSGSSLIALKDKGLDADEFQFLFEALEVAP